MKTIIVDFENGLCWEFEVKAYRFDYEATQDALNLMHNLRMTLAGEAGIGWEILYRSKKYLEAEMTAHFMPAE